MVEDCCDDRPAGKTAEDAQASTRPLIRNRITLPLFLSPLPIVRSKHRATRVAFTPMASAGWRSRDMATRLSCSVVGKAKA
jgi:hypothetical protein